MLTKNLATQLILVREKGLYIIKTDCSNKMVVAFTIKEKNCLLVSLFSDVVLPLSNLLIYLWYKAPNLAALFVLFPA